MPTVKQASGKLAVALARAWLNSAGGCAVALRRSNEAGQLLSVTARCVHLIDAFASAGYPLRYDRVQRYRQVWRRSAGQCIFSPARYDLNAAALLRQVSAPLWWLTMAGKRAFYLMMPRRLHFGHARDVELKYHQTGGN